VPLACTDSTAGAPSSVLTDCGCTVMVGAATASARFSVTAALVWLPAALLTTTRKLVPLSAGVVVLSV
jgi:hypothetical protein